MAIKFEDAKGPGKPVKSAPKAVERATADAPILPPDGDSPTEPGSTAQLPFGKPVKPEKKGRRGQK